MTKVSTRLLAAFLAFVTVILLVPFTAIEVKAESISIEDNIGFGFNMLTTSDDLLNLNKLGDRVIKKYILDKSKFDAIYDTTTGMDGKWDSFSSESSTEVTEKYQNDLTNKVGVSVPINGVTIGVDTTFATSTSSTTATAASNLYEIHSYRQRTGIAYIKNTPELSELKRYVTKEFSDKVVAIEVEVNKGELGTAQRLSQELVNCYGTHLITSFYAGVRLEATNHISSTEIKSIEELITSSKIGLSINSLGDLKFENENKNTYTKELTESNITQVMKIRTIGGITPTSVDNDSIQTYVNDVVMNNHMQLLEFVDNESLIGIWELVDDPMVKSLIKDCCSFNIGVYQKLPNVSKNIFLPLVAEEKEDINVKRNLNVMSLDVEPGSTLYLHITDADNVTYSVLNSSYGTINTKYNSITPTGNTTVYAYYGSIPIARLDITIKSCYPFSGGYGTEERPYLITEPSQLKEIENHLNDNFKLMNDIDMKDYDNWTPIGDISNADDEKYFTGVLDGNGHVISNLKIQNTEYRMRNNDQGNATAYWHMSGLFAINRGTIKNLIMSSITMAIGSDCSGKTASLNNLSGIFGIIAGENCGTIYGCRVENSTMRIRSHTKSWKYANESKKFLSIGGAICGVNREKGVIINCASINNSIDINENVYYDDTRGVVCIGGIAGGCDDNSIVRNCISKDCKFISNSRAGGSWNNMALIYIQCGGITGYAKSSILDNVLVVMKDSAFEDIDAIGETEWNGTASHTSPSGEEVGSIIGKLHSTPILFFNLLQIYTNKNTVGTSDVITPSTTYFPSPNAFANDKNYKDSIFTETSTTVNLQTMNKSHSHTYQNDLGISTQSCTAPGIIKYVCTDSACQNETYEITAKTTTHTYDNGKITTPATCTATGVKTYTCTECKATKTETIAKIEHTYNQKVTKDEYLKSAATCTSAAVYYYSCTCGAKGTTTFTSGSTVEHTYNSGVVTKAATCTATGVKTYTCTECKATKTETIAKTEHMYSTTWSNDETNHWHKCTACTAINDKSVHVYTDSTDNSCNTCGYVRSAVGCNHTYDSGVITKEPTCTVAGVKTYTCTVCKSTKTETIPPLAHKYSTTYGKDETNHWNICDVCKETAKKEVHVYMDCDKICDVCGFAGAVENHKYDSGVVTKAPTTTEAGIKTYTCTICSATKTETVEPIKPSEPKGTITVSAEKALAGKAVTVTVAVSDNPGVIGAMLKLSYPSELTLVDAESGEAFDELDFTPPGAYQPNGVFVWESIDTVTSKNGSILILKFKVPENAAVGTIYDISVSYKSGDVIDGDLNPVEFATVAGSVTVSDYVAGDLNNDGNINITDIVLLRRYISGGYNVVVNESAADVNKDGRFNVTDVILIRRYIAGGYGVVLK